MESNYTKDLIISNKNESLPLFKNPLLERLSHMHPITPVCIFVPVVAYFFYAAVIHTGIAISLLGFLIGLFLWTFIEYGMHRFIFHYHPKNERAKKFYFLMHGIHHAYPRDKTRLVLPPIISVFASALLCIAYRYLFGVHYESIFAGTMAGYLTYDLLHYSVHAFNPRNRLLRFLKRYHLSHHYLDANKGFGVSSPLWDYIFKTTAAGAKESEEE